jgi:hypothetical protein
VNIGCILVDLVKLIRYICTKYVFMFTMQFAKICIVQCKYFAVQCNFGVIFIKCRKIGGIDEF